MPDHRTIYEQQAERYHLLISKQAGLRRAVESIRPCRGLDIADVGAGTGRLTVELAPEARSIVALDASEAMLRIAAERLKQAGLTNWRTQTADLRKLPLEDNSADLVVAGWSICYLAGSHNANWESNLRAIIGEARRVLRDKGTIVIFETMGTGFETPNPPDFLIPYYAALVETYGFSHRWVRTDYRFDDVRQAEELTRFFFGPELAERVAAERLVRLPECAGIWWLHL
ncbi:class I SAM-dependent methyltransferase [Paenibacillus thermoaerophilus]|uniref:Class I SAM-dependent methyltransferase n=1 Tax=Paenibacillus thermoaerophilus TaxID=1215385 RepID=A0ABW2V4L6_9BACL|nr:class I SAM-dependent methyltransferase [Paenibacillus thermoaerophilus]TMV07334.1 class I SAM-dependent methyltransferase [Paenibacillus thermoaerophilus]